MIQGKNNLFIDRNRELELTPTLGVGNRELDLTPTEEDLRRFSLEIMIYLFGKFILRDEMTKEEGYIPTREKIEMEGALGVASSDLRPSGTALINDERYDVTTNGQYIKKGTRIQVIKPRGSQLLVKAVEDWDIR